MVVSRAIALMAFLVLLSQSAVGGTKDDLKKSKSELNRLRSEIESYEKKIQTAKKKERASLSLIDTYDRQSDALRRLVRRLQQEQGRNTAGAARIRDSIVVLETRLQRLGSDYASYVRSAYMHGRITAPVLFLSAAPYSELALRVEYLKRLSQQHHVDMEGIKADQTLLKQQRALLAENLRENERLIAERTREESRLAARIEERKGVIDDLRRNQKLWSQELDRRQRAQRALQRKISELIERDRIRQSQKKAHFAERSRSKPPPPSTAVPRSGLPSLPTGSSESFKPRSIPWPVSKGTVTARYGWHAHPELKTMTQNTGIDIAVESGTEVRAVADGEVAAVWWLPSFGTLIILSHGDGFRTVYAHLGEVHVAEGERVKQGQAIARSGETVSGSTLHFEVWKNREKMDPQAWLMSR